jgi:hypothetical protein
MQHLCFPIWSLKYSNGNENTDDYYTHPSNDIIYGHLCNVIVCHSFHGLDYFGNKQSVCLSGIQEILNVCIGKLLCL